MTTRSPTVYGGWKAFGLADFSREDIYKSGCADVDAVAATLGDKPFLLGDTPSSYDAILYGYVANTIAFPSESPVALRAKEHGNLVAFVKRMNDKYWSDAPAS